jgi:hypothetical protein
MPRTYAEGELSCPHLNSRGSLSREALLPYTLAAYKTPPPSFSHARTSSAAAAIGGCTMSSPSACSSSHLIPQTPPLGPVGARAVAHSPALPRSSTDFNPQRPLQPDTAARRRGWLLRPTHHHQSSLREHPYGHMSFIGQVRPAIAAGELTRQQKGRTVRIWLFARA